MGPARLRVPRPVGQHGAHLAGAGRLTRPYQHRALRTPDSGSPVLAEPSALAGSRDRSNDTRIETPAHPSTGTPLVVLCASGGLSTPGVRSCLSQEKPE